MIQVKSLRFYERPNDGENSQTEAIMSETKRRRYSEEFKSEAVRLARASSRPVAAKAKRQAPASLRSEQPVHHTAYQALLTDHSISASMIPQGGN